MNFGVKGYLFSINNRTLPVSHDGDIREALSEIDRAVRSLAESRNPLGLRMRIRDKVERGPHDFVGLLDKQIKDWEKVKKDKKGISDAQLSAHAIYVYGKAAAYGISRRAVYAVDNALNVERHSQRPGEMFQVNLYPDMKSVVFINRGSFDLINSDIRSAVDALAAVINQSAARSAAAARNVQTLTQALEQQRAVLSDSLTGFWWNHPADLNRPTLAANQLMAAALGNLAGICARLSHEIAEKLWRGGTPGASHN